jgi:membrane fusion protein (multidrug efflux system)
MEPGEKVHVSVDAMDGGGFEGTLSSLAPASGALFSLLPPENATGNFTKVVQRVPVRIELPADVLESGRLRAGLSVVVDIDTRTAPAEVASR